MGKLAFLFSVLPREISTTLNGDLLSSIRHNLRHTGSSMRTPVISQSCIIKISRSQKGQEYRFCRKFDIIVSSSGGFKARDMSMVRTG
nr:hypothetical protein Q903MT_gene5164 [Picea sitchensis]